MTKKIFKYPIAVAAMQSIMIQRDAEYLCVQTQYEQPTIWALVDPDAPLESMAVLLVGTGHNIPDNSLAEMRYLGTVQTSGGSFVWHVFVPKASS